MDGFGLIRGVAFGEEPPRVTVERLGDGAEVWLVANIERDTAERASPDGEVATADVWTADVVHYACDGVPDADDVLARFDELWAAHEGDGASDAERIEALEAQLADYQAALMELGDIIGGE